MKITTTDGSESEIIDLLEEIITILNSSVACPCYNNTDIYYNEVLSVGSSILTTIITHTAIVNESLP